jgi:hypothetical protein
MKPLSIVLSGMGRGLGEMVGTTKPMYNVSLFEIVTMNFNATEILKK